MMKLSIALAALFVAATSAPAQDPLTAAKKAATKAAAATNAHIEAEQKPEGQQKPPAKTTPKSAAINQQPAASSQKTPLPVTTGKPGTQMTIARSDTMGPPPSILREAYEYPREGRRDPFVSLLTTNELRPTLSDLRLTGILIDHSGRNSIATLRDMTNNNQYRVSTGATLGRMRVTAIRQMAVIFTIEEFGTTRKDSLVLRDSTKARVR